jgi:hypothetical protein
MMVYAYVRALHGGNEQQEEIFRMRTEGGPVPHVFILAGPKRQGSLQYFEVVTLQTAGATFRGESEVGHTPDMVVYSDGSANGNAAAQAVLQTAEADFQAVQGWFGGIALPAGHDGDDQNTPRTATPIRVLVDPQAGGAYHFGCDATDLYIQPDATLANGFMVAELVEVFEAAINNGWSCGQTNGEGLSRVLAGERNANLGADFAQTIQAWWSSGHADYVNSNNATDQDENSNGCATLFLYYLHSQLNFDWTKIVTTGGATLGETYQRLTGKSGAEGFSDFISRVATLNQGGQLSLPGNSNPFPIGGAETPAPSPQPGGSTGTPDPGTPDIPLPADVNADSAIGMLGIIVVVVAIIAVIVLILNATGAIHILG